MQHSVLAKVISICVVFVSVISCAKSPRPSPVFRPLSPGSVSLPALTGMPDNSLCLVCHVNFAENDSVANHISQGITCAHCHGKSVEHMNDESMMTPPDILHGRSEVRATCKQCHQQSHKNPKAVEVFRNKWAGQKRENGRNITEDSICTDCHGRHTVPHR